MTAISNMRDLHFSCQYRSWHISFDFENTYSIRIYLKGKNYYDFMAWWLDKNNEEKIDYREIREQLEKDPLFQETLERITQWEEKMTKQLTISDVNVIETFNYLGEKFYAIGCYVTSGLATSSYKLLNREEETLAQFDDVSEKDYIVVPLRKYMKHGETKPYFKYDQAWYYMYRTEKRYNAQPKINYSKMKQDIHSNNFYTHVHFTNNLVNRIITSSSFRGYLIKELFESKKANV